MTNRAERVLAKASIKQNTIKIQIIMTLHSRRNFVCFQRDVRNGSWYRVRLQVGRNKIHVGLDQSTDAQQDKKRFVSSVSFKLNDFKLEVGQFTSSVPAYYCLYLKSGHSRVTFGFETIELLEVRRVLLLTIIDFSLLTLLTLQHCRV